MIKKYIYPTYEMIVIYHLGSLNNSLHIIGDKKTQQACVIDPAWDFNLLIEVAQQHGFKINKIWLTHWHPDHTNATDALVQKTGARVYAGKNEKHYLRIINAPINFLDDGQIINIGKTKAEVIYTPGHTTGGVCYLLKHDLITGDTLFIYGAGHCILPGADSQQLFTSMQRIKSLDDDVFVRCGHDYGCKLTTTLGEQKRHNPFLFIDNKEDFIRYREHVHDKTRQYPMEAMTAEDVKQLLA